MTAAVVGSLVAVAAAAGCWDARMRRLRCDASESTES